MDLAELLLDLSPWLGGRPFVGQWPKRRDLQPQVLARLQDLGQRRATVILGPRQVGKSVILWQLAEDLLRAGWPPSKLVYFDFSDDRIVEPVTPRDVIGAAERVGPRQGPADPALPFALLLDEIGNVPRWDRWMKGAVDRAEARIVATDSAAGLLRDGARESGLGRWTEVELEGLSFEEFARIAPEGDPIARYLVLGGFPEYASGYSLAEARRTLREDIAYKAIERDLIERIDDVDAARRLFVYLVQDSGAIYNASQREKDLGVRRKSSSAWTRLFLDSRLLVSLPRRALSAGGGKAKAAQRLGTHPKVYAADHGLIHAFSPLPDPYEDEATRGQVFECVVFKHLRDLARVDPERHLSFHRPGTGEVDFVLDTPDGPILIEVTSARSASGKLRKLDKASAAIQALRTLLVYGGVDLRERDGVTLVPLPALLEDPARVVLGGDR